ncbi:MAG: zinc ribbon domain-containing protein [Anaerolineae bacterium]
MGHSHDPQSRSQVSRAEPQDTCPSCQSPLQANWKVCPHCGQELV